MGREKGRGGEKTGWEGDSGERGQGKERRYGRRRGGQRGVVGRAGRGEENGVGISPPRSFLKVGAYALDGTEKFYDRDNDHETRPAS